MLDAVQRCWASLWSDRAVAYREREGVPDEGLSLAVVVQRLVAAETEVLSDDQLVDLLKEQGRTDLT